MESGGGQGTAGANGAANKGKHGSGTTRAAAAGAGSSGVGVALGIVGGVLALLAGGVFLVNRRWPLPDLVRRLPRR